MEEDLFNILTMRIERDPVNEYRITALHKGSCYMERNMDNNDIWSDTSEFNKGDHLSEEDGMMIEDLTDDNLSKYPLCVVFFQKGEVYPNNWRSNTNNSETAGRMVVFPIHKGSINIDQKESNVLHPSLLQFLEERMLLYNKTYCSNSCRVYKDKYQKWRENNIQS
jgi:hypothetical protein